MRKAVRSLRHRLSRLVPFVVVMLTVAQARAADFVISDVPSIEPVAIETLKPNTIAFADHPGSEIVDPATGFMRYETWARAQPVQQQFLALYPGYREPNGDVIIDGVKKRYRQKLHMYVAAARFELARPPASLDLARFTTLQFLEQIDPAIKHKLITPAELTRPKEPKIVFNQDPQRSWCEGRPTTICVRSVYKLEGRLPAGIALANKIRERAKKIADYLEFDSELSLLSPAQVDEAGLAKLTGLATPSAGAIEQSIFYVNQVMEFGKLIAVFQQHPSDAGKTVATVYVALAIESSILGKRSEFSKVPVLRNLVPAQVLSGKSSFNTGKSLSAGLPAYARNQVKAIAGLLDRK
jgi:hypothetical protein